MKKKFRVNQDISTNFVYLIDEKGEKIGKIETNEARMMAVKSGLDLVEVSPNSEPPVCKIMDFGSFLFEKKKKEKLQKKSSKSVETKSIRIGIRISDHDLLVKQNSAIKFLQKGCPVKLILKFRGREVTHSDLGFQKIDKFFEGITEYAKIDQEPKQNGMQITTLFIPVKKGKK